MTARILVVDDDRDSREVLRARLASQGYSVELAGDGNAALALIAASAPDVILLDVMMPGLDGLATVRRLKTDPTLPFIPVILLTARSAVADIVAGLEAGADEYLVKPVDHAALTARVLAMLRIRALQDQVAAQARQLAAWNAALQTRVAAQLEELERLSRLKRFLAPQVAEALLASDSEERALASQRAEVSVLFCDLRGFSRFSGNAGPEEVMDLLRAYHALVGEESFAREGTIERFAGDAVMILFGAPLPNESHARSAAGLAVALRNSVGALLSDWDVRGHQLGFGIGVAAGPATVGRIGFHRRFDYAAIGPVTNLAARLCAMAGNGQILVDPGFALAAEWPSRPVGRATPKGFVSPIEVHELCLEAAGPPATTVD